MSSRLLRFLMRNLRRIWSFAKRFYVWFVPGRASHAAKPASRICTPPRLRTQRVNIEERERRFDQFLQTVLTLHADCEAVRGVLWRQLPVPPYTAIARRLGFSILEWARLEAKSTIEAHVLPQAVLVDEEAATEVADFGPPMWSDEHQKAFEQAVFDSLVKQILQDEDVSQDVKDCISRNEISDCFVEFFRGDKADSIHAPTLMGTAHIKTPAGGISYRGAFHPGGSTRRTDVRRPIVVTRGLSHQGLHFGVTHELAHWLLGEDWIRHHEPNEFQKYDDYVDYLTIVEHAANRLTYELLMPEYLFRQWASEHPPHRIASLYCVDEFHVYARLFSLFPSACEFAIYLRGEESPAMIYRKEVTPRGVQVLRFCVQGVQNSYDEYARMLVFDQHQAISTPIVSRSSDEGLLTADPYVKELVKALFEDTQRRGLMFSRERHGHAEICWSPIRRIAPPISWDRANDGNAAPDEVLVAVFGRGNAPEMRGFCQVWSKASEASHAPEVGFHSWIDNVRALLDLTPRPYTLPHAFPPCGDGTYPRFGDADNGEERRSGWGRVPAG